MEKLFIKLMEMFPKRYVDVQLTYRRYSTGKVDHTYCFSVQRTKDQSYIVEEAQSIQELEEILASYETKK